MSTRAGAGGNISGGASSSIHDNTDFDLRNVDDANDSTLLEDDFLNEGSQNTVSFKRKQKQPSRLSLPKFLQPLPNPGSRPSSTPPYTSNHIRRLREQSSRNHSDNDLSTSNRFDAEGTNLNDQKDGSSLDWYADGPRRRVGYDDLTAIDWIFEYTKERQRLRLLYSRATGLLGQAQKFFDASQIWLVLVGTGLTAGVLAASINVASDWLADLKEGYCASGAGGGRFYLNKEFCCWGHDEWAQCLDWTPWSSLLHVSSAAGSYMIQYIVFILLAVFYAVCACLLVRDYAQYAKHSGIPEIKTVLGGYVIRRFMSFWTLVVKSLGLCLAVASGLWLGKEGPLVHVACCCANLLMKLSSNLNDNEARKREVLSAAAAAGISVAFGSPIGGVLFSLEQLSYYFPDKTMWQSFVCAMVAAVTLQAFNPLRTGQLVLYQVTYSTGWHGFEILPFALLGIIGGLYGGLFIKLNMKIAKWRRSSRISETPVLEVSLVAIATALVSFPIIFMRAQASELVYALFAECAALTEDQFGICKMGAASAGSIALLLISAMLSFLFASMTFGLQIPAGIILPSMAIGALYGRALGIVVEHVQQGFPNSLIFLSCEPDTPCVTPGTYAVIGAASALGGVTRMTVSIVVIMFELTGALTYVLPIMIAVMLSKWVGDAFGKRGIYETWIHFHAYPFLDHKDDAVIPDVPLPQLMTRVEDLASITATGHTLQTLHDFLLMNPYRGFPVVTDLSSNILLGYITRTELIFALKSAAAESRKLPPTTELFFSHQPDADPHYTLDLRPWMDQTPITLNAKSTLQLTIDMFQKLGLKYVLFCDRGALKGLLTKKDVWCILDSDDEDRPDRLTGGVIHGRMSEERNLMADTPTTENGLFEHHHP